MDIDLAPPKYTNIHLLDFRLKKKMCISWEKIIFFYSKAYIYIHTYKRAENSLILKTTVSGNPIFLTFSHLSDICQVFIIKEILSSILFLYLSFQASNSSLTGLDYLQVNIPKFKNLYFFFMLLPNQLLEDHSGLIPSWFLSPDRTHWSVLC